VAVTPKTLCLIVAAVLFAAAALWVPSSPPRLNLVPAGLTFLTLGLLLP
jgi:hypothetical protein